MRWEGEYRPHAHTAPRNLFNGVLCALVLLPIVRMARLGYILVLPPLTAGAAQHPRILGWVRGLG
jgi:hypothetical protein